MLKKKNLALVGFMGAGKSMVSNRLSDILGRSVVSTDDFIIKEAKMEIPQIFELHGEEHFRKMERLAVAKASAMENVIIDCGGGVVLNPENVALLKETGVMIYLSASPECILQNLKKVDGLKDRPLLNVQEPLKKIKELLEERSSFYKQADITVNADWKTIEDIAQKVCEVIKDE